MTKRPTRIMAASVRQRLMNKAKEQQEAFDVVLIRYALERLLYRIAMSVHHDRFVLKGAMLFQVWSRETHRPSRDLDLLGSGTPSLDDFTAIFSDACQQDCCHQVGAPLHRRCKSPQDREPIGQRGYGER